MTELETSSGSESDKLNKRHKYILKETLQSRSEFNNKGDYTDLSEWG